MSLIEGHQNIIYDCEVFCEDWLFVFKHEDGTYTSFWNDPQELVDFIEANSECLFFGFNSSRYDQYILKAIVAGCEPPEVKEVNDWIIGTDNQPWEHPYLQNFFYSFNDVDLMKDTQMGTSLKSIEGHAGMSVEESNVPFDIDRKLTEEERTEVEKYCRHDVDATEKLLEIRRDYILTKANLGERAGLDVTKAVALTNAKLTAAVLKADREEHDDERQYTYPDNLLLDYIPPKVVEFFDRMKDEDIPDEELWSSKLEITVGGCPVTLGFGGIHGALPKFKSQASEGKKLVNADVASYYPSLMVKNGYSSRNMPDPSVFEAIYTERLEAKAAGDKATANALKLIVNTTYGATLNQYNDLYDPLMARSVCISGQLYLLELACHLTERLGNEMELVQLNTDGILVGLLDGAVAGFEEICAEWQERTGFALEFDDVERIWQKDVNNYAMRLADGKEKVKGGYLVRGAQTVGAFSINNTSVIVAEALKSYLLDGVPVHQTIEACDDPEKFQIIAKAGSKYSRVYQEIYTDTGDEETGVTVDQIEMQKCNRVYATRDESLGRLYKVKAATSGTAKIESLPEHCLVCNDLPPSILNIDKEWYIALAEKRAADFESKEDKPMATTRATKTATKAATDYTSMNIYQKLALARKRFLEAGVKKTGINRHQEYDYFQLEDIVPTQTMIFEELGLLEIFTYKEGEGEQVLRTDEEGVVLSAASDALGIATVVNTDKPEETIEFRIPWVDMPAQKNKDGKTISNPLQDQGKVQTYLRRYLKMQVLDLAEYDVTDGGEKEEVKEKAPSASKTTPKAKVETADKKSAGKPATASQRKQAAAKVTGADGEATKLQIQQLRKQAKKLKDAYGETHPEIGAYLVELGAETGNLKNISKARCEQAIRDLGEMKEKIETEGGAE